MTEGSREALTAGGARLQARKQIAASRDRLDAGLVSASPVVFLAGAQNTQMYISLEQNRDDKKVSNFLYTTQ
jgi:hypothetical protein